MAKTTKEWRAQATQATAGAAQFEKAENDCLEDRLATLARSAGPLRGVVAGLAGRIVRRRAYQTLGFARLADYARERLGVSARTMQDWALVAERLAVLPALEAALRTGLLPWSKVRLLARFASPENVHHFIGIAEGLSVGTLERQLRAVVRGSLEAAGGRDMPGTSALPKDAEEKLERLSLSVPIPVAFQWRRTCREAAKVAGESTPEAAVLEWVTAEVVSGLGLATGSPQLAQGLDLAPGGAAAGGRTACSAPAVFSFEAEAEAEAEAEVESECDEVPALDRCAANVCASHEAGFLPPPTPASVAGALKPAASVCAGDDVRAIGQADGCENCPLPAFLEPLIDGLESCDPHELDARLRRAVRLEQRLEAEIAPLLQAVTSADHLWRDRYRSVAAYARERLGMSPRKARALLRLERLGGRCPELRAAYRDGALSWVQAQQVARLVVGGEADDSGLDQWVAWAQRVSVRKLEETVGRALLWRAADPHGLAGVVDPEAIAMAAGDEPQSAVAGERQTCARSTPTGERVHVRVVAPRPVAQLFRAALCSVRLALEQATGRAVRESEGFEAMLDHALQAWNVRDPWLRRRLKRSRAARIGNAIFERDGWRCTVPGCTSRRNLHAHHIVFRSAGGSDALENQTTLCAFHHQKGVHAGRVRISGQAPEELHFELGTGGGRPPLVRYRSGDRLV